MPSGPAVGGILCFYRRCLALVRCSHSLTSSSNFEQATWQYSLTRVARPCRPNTVWFSEITRPLAVTRSRSLARSRSDPRPRARRARPRHIRSRIAACGRGARRTPGAAGPRSPAPHMMTRARARPRTGAARDRYIFGFQAPFQFIHGMRSRGGAGRAHGAHSVRHLAAGCATGGDCHVSRSIAPAHHHEHSPESHP